MAPLRHVLTVLPMSAVLGIGCADTPSSMPAEPQFAADLITLRLPPGCTKITGKFSFQAVMGPACVSAIGVCSTGSITGGPLAGDFSFTGTSAEGTIDSPITQVIAVTGDRTIQTKLGTLSTKDAHTQRTSGVQYFAGVWTIVAGTGAWADASGFVQAIGVGATSGEGEFSGQVCT